MNDAVIDDVVVYAITHNIDVPSEASRHRWHVAPDKLPYFSKNVHANRIIKTASATIAHSHGDTDEHNFSILNVRAMQLKAIAKLFAKTLPLQSAATFFIRASGHVAQINQITEYY